jgi:hypothetical protein
VFYAAHKYRVSERQVIHACQQWGVPYEGVVVERELPHYRVLEILEAIIHARKGEDLRAVARRIAEPLELVEQVLTYARDIGIPVGSWGRATITDRRVLGHSWRTRRAELAP